jgi:hypothetical protein
LAEILGKNSKRNLQDSYIEKGYRNDSSEIKYTSSQESFLSIREVMSYINGLNSKDVFYLIEHDDQNKLVLYRSGPQKPQPSEDASPVSPAERGLRSSKQKYYRVTNERIFGEFQKNFETFEESITYLEKDILSENKRGAYWVEYNSAGKQIFHGSHSVFQYHDQKDVLFTPSTIYLPNAFKDHYDVRLYLRGSHRIYKTANPDKLMPDEVKEIGSFIKVDVREGLIVLANELKHYDKHQYSVKNLEKSGLLTEVRLIETLTRGGFLQSLQ